MTRASRWVAVLGAVALTAACSARPPVAVERSDQAGDGPVIPDGQARLPSTGQPGPTDDSDLPVVATPNSSIDWGGCDSFDIPPADLLGTAAWQCAVLTVPMDPFAEGAGGDETVDLAITMHPATGDRRGSILINPGGPGAAGLPTAWNVRGGLSPELLRAFDIVSWDPRGVGESSPRIDCDDDVTVADPDFIAACVEATGPLAGFVGAPYSAADMEAIRVALGDERLDYLGYSYGSILGATYAAAHPDRVGAFVLDGVTDPLAGSADGPFEDGFPVLADAGTDAAIERFAELCDATDRCLAGLDTTDVLDDLSLSVWDLATDDFAGQPDRVDGFDFGVLVDSTMTFAGDWELFATALSDADDGDASALASLIAGSAEEVGEGGGESDFAEANFLIYCADLGPWIAEWSFCDAMPDADRQMHAVSSVDVEREILVIGTEYDPLTPGYHAPAFAAALGDAVHIIWEGVGHTAYPGWTSCVDDVVTDQFLRRSVATDGLTCSFLFDIDDDATLGDELFGQGDFESFDVLAWALDGRGVDADPVCVADEVNQSSDQVISHVVLDVTSDQARSALDDARSACE